MHALAYLRKSLVLLALLLPVLSAKAVDGYSYRLNLGFGYYNDKQKNTSISPGFVGIDFGWRMHKYINLYLGLNYWDAEQSINWWNNSNQYYWDGSISNLMVTGSARFATPTLNLGRERGISFFIEPGINIEPISIGNITLDEYPNGDNSSISYSNTNVRFFYPSWQLNTGISYKISNELFVDLSYMISSMDLLRVYRGMSVAGQDINDYLPDKKMLKAVRFTLGLNL